MPWNRWRPGDPVTINRIVWDGLESEFVQDVFERDWFGPGHYAAEFERILAQYIGVRHAQLTNSGSSALLLATKALQRQGKWRRFDLILHPACTFPAPANVIVQTGMIPVFVDVEEGTYNINVTQVEQALDLYPHIRGAIIPHLLGNSPPMKPLMDLLDHRPLIEDCCDTLGSAYDGRMCGTFGRAAAFSFYGSHHITTAGVGGALMTDDEELATAVKSMAFWGRQFVDNGDPYLDFIQRYTYETLGFDMQMTDIQAAFGLAQMRRLRDDNQRRVRQFTETYNFLWKWQHWLVLPWSYKEAEPSWFGFPLLVKEKAPFGREQFVRHLLDNKIEIRPLFAGNLTRQPAYEGVHYIIAGDLTQSDRNMERAFFLPAWGGMTEAQTAHMFEVIEEFMGRW
jgi:CDP-6-deoxy-D-xylo-4-hexulose-3-dehydrase